MNCVIIEDQPPAQRILKRYIQDYGNINLIGVFEDPLKAKETLDTSNIDLIFLDIHLPKLSGIDFLKTLKDPPSVIITTAFSEFALVGYELNVIDYLLKPFSFARFIQAVDKTFDRVSSKDQGIPRKKAIYVKTGYDYEKVLVEDIIYIKADGDYTEIHLADKKLLSSDTLKQWIDTYSEFLIRVHRSYVINKNRILKIRSASIHLNGDFDVPIGRAFKEDVAQLL